MADNAPAAEPAPPSDNYSKGMWDVLYYLIKNKKAGTALLVFVFLPFGIAILVAWALYYIMSPKVELSASGAAITVKSNIFAPRITSLLVHPRGWQDTGIIVSPGDVLTVRVSGEVNMGVDIELIRENSKAARTYIDSVLAKMKTRGISDEQQGIAEAAKTGTTLKTKAYPEHGWPWVDYHGYHRDTIARLKKLPQMHDPSLISPDKPLGRLVGYAGPDGCPELLKRGNEHVKFEPIIDFTHSQVTVPAGVTPRSHLCLAVNDSVQDEWQYDNFGLFMVTIEN